MAFDPSKLSDITNSTSKAKSAESGIASNPLNRNSDLSSAENTKPINQDNDDRSNKFNKRIGGSKGTDSTTDKLKEDAKAAEEGAKLAADIADGNELAAAKNLLTNRELYTKVGKRISKKIIIACIGIGILGMIVFAAIISLVGAGTKAMVHALYNASGAEMAHQSLVEAKRTLDVMAHGYHGNNTELADNLKQLKTSRDKNNNNLLMAFKNVGISAYINKDGYPVAGGVVIRNKADLDLVLSTQSQLQLQIMPQTKSFQDDVAKPNCMVQQRWPDGGSNNTSQESSSNMLKDAQASSYKQTTCDGKTTVNCNAGAKLTKDACEAVRQAFQDGLSKGTLGPAAKAMASKKVTAGLVKVVHDTTLLGPLQLPVFVTYGVCMAQDNLKGIATTVNNKVGNSIRQASVMASAADQNYAGNASGNKMATDINLYTGTSDGIYNQGYYQLSLGNKDWSDTNKFTIPDESSAQEGTIFNNPPTGTLGTLYKIGNTLKSLQIEHLGLHFTYGQYILSAGCVADRGAVALSGGAFGVASKTPSWAKSLMNWATHGIAGYVGNKITSNAEDAVAGKNLSTNSAQYTAFAAVVGLAAPGVGPLAAISAAEFPLVQMFAHALYTSIINNVNLSYTGTADDQYTNNAAAGFSMMNDEYSRKAQYGRPLTLGELKENDDKQAEYQNIRYAHMSTWDKFASLSNPTSLASQLSVVSLGLNRMPFSKVVSSVGNSLSLVSQPSSILNTVGTLAVSTTKISNSSIAYASEDPNAYISNTFPNKYMGNIQWGWSQAENNLIQNDASYGMLQNANTVESWIKDQNSAEARYITSITPCFTDNIGNILASELTSTNDKDNLLKTCEDMSSSTVVSPNLSHEDVSFRYRLYMKDKTYISDLQDLQTVTQDGSSSSSATSTAGTSIDMANLTKDSTSVACAPNTQDIGTQDGYSGGTKVEIKLCAVPNLPSSGQESQTINGANGNAVVNSRVSGAVYAMVAAAKAAGVNLSATSSFRTMSHQEQLYAAYQNGTGNLAAKPGTSNHQMGLAVDFNTTGHSGAVWDWLNTNAAKFGYKNLPSEPWHWSPTGN